MASIKKNDKDKIIADLITGDKADILITDAYPYWLCKWKMRRMHEISRIFFHGKGMKWVHGYGFILFCVTLEGLSLVQITGLCLDSLLAVLALIQVPVPVQVLVPCLVMELVPVLLVDCISGMGFHRIQ